MKRLAGVLSFVCTVLFLLAIEQSQTVAAWEAVRHEAGPAARRVADWAGRLPAAAADGFDGLKAAARGQSRPLAARRGSDAVLSGEYSPADAATREAVGTLTFVGAELRFGRGGSLRTRPLRIARGRDAFAAGQTFGARLNAPADAQIELRQAVPPARGQAAAALSLCGGEPAGAVALLQRGARVDVMLFRTAEIGPDAPPSALCGAWSFTVR
jgi:hypothetical protein